jgi:hypothetical protein
MNKLAAVLLCISFGLLTAGAALLHTAAGLITAGVLAGAAGVLSMTAGPTMSKTEREPR